jgi:RHS repeat-associated protein
MENDGLITLPEKNSYWHHYRKEGLFNRAENRFDNLYPATEGIFLYTGLRKSGSDQITPLQAEVGFIDIFCANIDGKQSEEVIKVNNFVSGSNDQVIFRIYSRLGPGMKLDNTRIFNLPTVLIDNAGYKSIHPKFYFPGDFNGDGKTEILAVSCHQPFEWTGTQYSTKCYLFDLEAGVKMYDAIPPFTYNVSFAGSKGVDSTAIANNTDKLFVLDYDGDGKSDICLINTTGTHIYTFDVVGTTYSMRHVASYTGLKRSDLNGKILLIGDFNGDGKPDFLLTPIVNASDWFVYYSMGNGMFEKKPAYISTRYDAHKFLIQDVNSDGMTDVIVYNTSGFYTHPAKPGGFIPLPSNLRPFDYPNPIFIPAGINIGNNFNQLLALKDSKITRFSHKRNDAKEKLLTGAVTSFGVVGKNYYRMLTQSYAFYYKGYGAIFPHENFTGPLFVTECREQYFNGIKNETISYLYENAVIHKQGLGFCGFEKITEYDEIRGRIQYQKFDPYKFGILKEVDSPVANNAYIYSVAVSSNKIAKVRLTNLSVQDKLRGITQTYSYTYNTYGYPLAETVNYGGGIIKTVSNDYYNNTNETGYLLGFLTDRRDTISRNLSKWAERYQVPTHNNKGQPYVTVRYKNGNQVLQETFSYDAQGNDTTYEQKTFTSTNPLKIRYTYDAYGRLKTKTNPLGLTTTNFYNSSTGRIDSIRDHKNRATRFTFDPFGRINRIDYADGAIETSSYYWTTTEKGANTLFCNYRHHYGKPWTKTFYDALGRETASNVLIPGGAESGPNNLYDSYGRLWKVSLPITSGSPNLWNEYQYDSYDRPTKLTEASGRITSYAYSKDTIATTSEGITSKRIFNTQGNLVKVIDPGGTITYNMRPDGQPSSIVVPGNVTTSFTYDTYGRQLTITDPGAGTQTYTYHPAGMLATIKDANNKTISFDYDAYNRLYTKTTPEFTANYRYNSDGQLRADSISSTRFTAYTYDAYGRPATEKETVEANRWLRKDFYYLGNGLPSETAYYNDNGYITGESYSYANANEGLWKITVNGTDIFKRNTVNAFGQTTNVTTGNGGYSYSYNNYGILTAINSSDFNSDYSFDAAKGNLTWRKDLRRNIQENFTYDNLNRLQTFAGITAVYNEKGNLASRTDLGTIGYNFSGKPYAISGVTAPTGNIPLRSQTITYTSFKRPATISEGEFTAAFTYNSNGSRTKMELKKNGAKELNRYYLSDCYEIDDRAVGGIKEKLYLGGDFYTAPAVYVKDGSGNWQLHSIYRDYQGSIISVSKANSGVQELSYDAWGRLRNPNTQAVYTPANEPVLFLGRGYTGHEHLPQFGLINMNARLYDPAVGRFLSPDPYIQNPFLSQNFNRYTYCINNPLKYTDPDGEWFWIAAAIYFTFFTDAGYQLQKYVSPVAFQVDFKWGTHQKGLGFNVGVGVPKLIPYAPWVEYGATYYWKNWGDYQGWETRKGTETTYFGIWTDGETKYKSGEFSQTVGYKKLGIPGVVGVDVYNDLWGDGGDRFRTSRVHLNFGFGYLENVLFTGDPGLYEEDRYDERIEKCGPNRTYIKNPNDPYAPDPDKYRHGVLSIGIGPISFGYDSENIRYFIQNMVVHNLTDSRYFRYDKKKKGKWYFQFGGW